MGKTIQFCGDSFCADTDEISWTIILASKLGAKITGVGSHGTAHENVFKSFRPDTTYTVICWTDANRVHAPGREYAALPGLAQRFHPNSPTFTKAEGKFWSAALGYYKYLHSVEYARERQERELYWFDQTVLSQANSKIVHLFGFENIYTFVNGYTHNETIKSMYKTLHSGLKRDTYPNHLSPEDNASLAAEVYKHLSQNHE
tara:strand:- start:164 stop:769 length:606 start_codon:yes stop_codon:yes gene_type:complete